jgi:hypothetical protein
MSWEVMDYITVVSYVKAYVCMYLCMYVCMYTKNGFKCRTTQSGYNLILLYDIKNIF